MKSHKKLLIIISTVVLLSIIIVCAYMLFKPRYRSVKLEEYDGTVALTRQDKDVEPYKGIMLKPLDTVETMRDSFAALNVDNDKHLGVKENTKLSINATGTDESGKVTVDLLYGEAIFEIENKLNADSYFEVTTQNATLSVRGTTFDVSYISEDNTSTISVTDGTVAVNYGKDLEKQLLLNAGESVIIKDEDILEDTEEAEDTADARPDWDYYFLVVRDFGFPCDFDINQRGRVYLMDQGVSYEEAMELGYENDYGIYDTYLAPHDEEIKQFIMESKAHDEETIFTDNRETLDKDITDWFPEDFIMSLGDKEIQLTNVSVHVLYEFYGGSRPDDTYQETLMANPDPNATDKNYAQAYAVSFMFQGIELK